MENLHMFVLLQIQPELLLIISYNINEWFFLQGRVILTWTVFKMNKS